MRFSILLQAILTHLVVAVLPMAGLGFAVYRAQVEALESAAHDRNLAVVTQLRTLAEARIEARAETLRLAARLLELTDGESSPDSLLRAMIAETDIAGLGIYDPSGQLDGLAWHGEQRPLFPKRIEASVTARSADEGSAISSRTSSTTDNLVVVPLRLGATLRGFLAAHLPSAPLSEDLARFRERFLGPGGQAWVLEAHGPDVRTIAGIDSAAELPPVATTWLDSSSASRPLAMEVGTTGRAGDWYHASVHAQSLSWWFVAAQPRSVAFAEIDLLRRRILVFSAIGAILAALVGLLLARSLSAPIEALAIAVGTAVKSGLLEKLAEPRAPELAQLARGFNRAVVALSQRRRELAVESSMRRRLSRYLTSRDLETAFSQDLERVPGENEPGTFLLVDLAPTEEGKVGDLPPDRLVLFLGELFALTAETIEARGGTLHPRAGDTVVGAFAGSPDATARRTVSTAHEILTRSQSLMARWQHDLGAVPAPSIGVASDLEYGSAEARFDRAGLLQRLAPALSLAVDEVTFAQLDKPADFRPTPAPELDAQIYIGPFPSTKDTS